MIKKLIYFTLLFINTLYLGINIFNFKVFASATNVYLVFDKITYNSNEIVTLNINLDQFSNLSEVKLQIRVDLEYLEPVLVNDEYFTFSTSSICTNDIVNDFTIDNILRLSLLKEEGYQGGYFSSYKNNICNIMFKTKKPIDNIYSYFLTDKYSKANFSIYLFDINDNLINYECKYLEKINILWDIESYELEVNSEVPLFKDDILVKNRDITEYEYLIEKAIDTSTIGLKTIHIAIYDLLTADYIVLSKAINVVDNTPPVIEVKSSYDIVDTKIDEGEIYNDISVSDNYDLHCSVFVSFYDALLEEIDSDSKFIDYLKENSIGYFKVIASDSSNNVTTSEFIKVNVIDTTAPIINKVEEIYINDIDIDNLNLLNYIEISDSYDKNPNVIIEYQDNYTFEEIKKLLKEGTIIEFKYYGIDNAKNKTDILSSKIIPIDTMSPSIELSDIVVNDVDYNNINYNDYLKVYDNFKSDISLDIRYYIDDTNVSKEEFDEMIQKGNVGYITYIAIDSNNNSSSEVIQHIKVNDTLAPVVIIKNIKDQEKYIGIDKIEYEITDNFEGCNVKILLDNSEYLGEEILLGSHIFYIEAVDNSGNKTIVEVNFEIIEDNIIGCGNDFSCYINNYLEVVIIVCVLMLFVVGLIVAHIIIKNKKEEIS